MQISISHRCSTFLDAIPTFVSLSISFFPHHRISQEPFHFLICEFGIFHLDLENVVWNSYICPIYMSIESPEGVRRHPRLSPSRDHLHQTCLSLFSQVLQGSHSLSLLVLSRNHQGEEGKPILSFLGSGGPLLTPAVLLSRGRWVEWMEALVAPSPLPLSRREKGAAAFSKQEEDQSTKGEGCVCSGLEEGCSHMFSSWACLLGSKHHYAQWG